MSRDTEVEALSLVEDAQDLWRVCIRMSLKGIFFRRGATCDNLARQGLL